MLMSVLFAAASLQPRPGDGDSMRTGFQRSCPPDFLLPLSGRAVEIDGTQALAVQRNSGFAVCG